MSNAQHLSFSSAQQQQLLVIEYGPFPGAGEGSSPCIYFFFTQHNLFSVGKAVALETKPLFLLNRRRPYSSTVYFPPPSPSSFQGPFAGQRPIPLPPHSFTPTNSSHPSPKVNPTMSSFAASLLLALAAVSTTSAHMQISKPYPFNSAFVSRSSILNCSLSLCAFRAVPDAFLRFCSSFLTLLIARVEPGHTRSQEGLLNDLPSRLGRTLPLQGLHRHG